MTDTATKFHITKKGAVEPCNASVKACPLGGQHFDSEGDAQNYLAFEVEAENEALRRKAKALVAEVATLQLDATSEGAEQEITDSWGKKRTFVLDRSWQVKDASGLIIGELEYRMVAYEKRRSDNPRARRRWMAPGWVYSVVSEGAQRPITHQTSSKKAALEGLLFHHKERSGQS